MADPLFQLADSESYPAPTTDGHPAWSAWIRPHNGELQVAIEVGEGGEGGPLYHQYVLTGDFAASIALELEVLAFGGGSA